MMRILLIATMMIFLLLLSCSGEEKIVEVPVPVNCVPPAPTGVYAINVDGYIYICWFPSYVTDIDYYEILKADFWEGPYSWVATLNATYAQPYEYCLDFDMPNGEQYFYAVRAVDTGGLRSELSPDYVTATARWENPQGEPLTLNERDLLPELSGYDFVGLTNTAQYDTLESTDILYDVIQNELDEEIPYLVGARAGVEIQDYGFVGTNQGSYDGINYAPEMGWAPTRKSEAIVGHCYILQILESDGLHYAKITVIEVTPNYVTFFWAYQSDPGNKDFAPRPDDDDPKPDIRSQKLEIKFGRLYPPSLREGSTSSDWTLRS
jgi:hypothetical protein